MHKNDLFSYFLLCTVSFLRLELILTPHAQPQAPGLLHAKHSGSIFQLNT